MACPEMPVKSIVAEPMPQPMKATFDAAVATAAKTKPVSSVIPRRSRPRSRYTRAIANTAGPTHSTCPKRAIAADNINRRACGEWKPDAGSALRLDVGAGAWMRSPWPIEVPGIQLACLPHRLRRRNAGRGQPVRSGSRTIACAQQELQQQRVDLRRLLLLHPVPRAGHEVNAEPARAGLGLHA